MRRGTKPILLFFARMIQSIPPYLLTWMEFFIKKKQSINYPIIFIISYPRSGSTLTYQILNRGTKSLYLSNIWNLLYALPFFGAKYTNEILKNKNFSSDIGLVPGFSGESEGMKFWSYWMGQGLEEKRNLVSSDNLEYLKSLFATLLKKDKPMISGYLGHAFSINFLRKHFPGSFFIYLKRDELSNIYSMLKTYKRFQNNRKNFNWFSLKPKGWQDKKDKDKIEKIFWQYKSIKKNIESQILDNDTFTVNYDTICKEPRKFLRDIKSFALNHNIDLQLILENIPRSFNVSKINPNLDNDSRIIYKLLKNE